MRVLGLITEYNPFHNGHKYHIDKAKELTNSDYVIVIMSGNFVQRGTPAIIDKYARTKMALLNGADLVFELPTSYSTASAEYFAHGAVSILDKLSIVDCLCFGSESGDLKSLNSINNIIKENKESLDLNIVKYLKQGFSFPSSRQKALNDIANNNCNLITLNKEISSPNNILSIEYLKALDTFNSKIEPVTIKRYGSDYHDKDINSIFSSATSIRNNIEKYNTENDLTCTKSSLPSNVYEILKNEYKVKFPITMEDFTCIIKYKLLSESSDSLSQYLDISYDLADRMKNNIDLNSNIEDLALNIKTKNNTLTRINRSLIHLVLNIFQEDMDTYINNSYTPYARLLGMKKESSKLLKEINNTGRIPIINKVSNAYKQLDKIGMKMLSNDIFASDLYNQIVYEKYNTKLLSEYQHSIISSI
ncbi:MAG TPA: nucleotidyltransferase [Clostridiales bacterium]|nr:nucleotidyltransferase [Clostridiales bacterium]